MLYAFLLDSVLKLHADVDEFSSVHAALFLSEGFHKKNLQCTLCVV